MQKYSVVINDDDVNCRRWPDKETNVVRLLKKGTQGTAFDFTIAYGGHTWAYVQIGTDFVWVAKEYLDKVAAPAPVPTPVPATTNKVGLHLMGTLTSADIQRAIALNAAVYKGMDTDAIIPIHQALPDRVYTFRHYMVGDRDPDIGKALDNWFGQVGTQLQSMPWAYFEGWNEVGLDDNYLEFERQRVLRLAAMSRKACVLNSSVGAESPDLWRRAKALVDTVIQCGGVIGVHGYAQTIMSNNYAGVGFDAGGHWQGLMFPTVKDTVSAWAALRVLMDIEQLKAQGQAPQFVITEMGLDDLHTNTNGINYGPLGKTQGWKSCVATWQYMGLLVGRTPEDFYRKQLAWWNDRVADVPQVVGGVVYTFGTDDHQWDNFDVRTVF